MSLNALKNFTKRLLHGCVVAYLQWSTKQSKFCLSHYFPLAQSFKVCQRWEIRDFHTYSTSHLCCLLDSQNFFKAFQISLWPSHFTANIPFKLFGQLLVDLVITTSGSFNVKKLPLIVFNKYPKEENCLQWLSYQME